MFLHLWAVEFFLPHGSWNKSYLLCLMHFSWCKEWKFCVKSPNIPLDSCLFSSAEILTTVFDWVLKMILDCFRLALLRPVIVGKNSRCHLNRSNAKIRLIQTCSLAFSRVNPYSEWQLRLIWFWFFDTIKNCSISTIINCREKNTWVTLTS